MCSMAEAAALGCPQAPCGQGGLLGTYPAALAQWGGSPGALPAHRDTHESTVAGEGLQQLKLEEIGCLHYIPIR